MSLAVAGAGLAGPAPAGAKRSHKARSFRQSLAQIRKDPWLFGIFLLVTVSLVLFSLFPIVNIMLEAGSTEEDGFSLAALAELFGESLIWRTFFNTMLLGVSSSLVSVVVGFILAFTVTRTTVAGRKFLHLIALLPIVTPPLVLAIALILLFGRSGVISSSLGLSGSVYGFQSLLLIQVLAFTPIAYLNIRGMLLTANGALDDASASLGAGKLRTFLKVTLPLAAPSLVSSFLLVFVKAIEDFGNPLVLGGEYRVLATEAYTQIIGLYDLRTGALMASMLMIPSLLAFMISGYWARRRSFTVVDGKPQRPAQPHSERSVVVGLGILSWLFAATILLFYVTLVLMSFVKVAGINHTLTLEHYQKAFTSGMRAITDTLILGGLATPVAVLMGLVVAFLLVRKAFPGSKLLRLSTIVGYGAPGTIVGLGLAVTFNDYPLALTGTALIIIISMVTRNMQVGIEAGQNQLKQIDPALEEASAALGASNSRTFRRVTLPLLKPALFTSVAYTFTRSITSISAVIFLVSANWSLLTVTILDQMELSRLSLASAYGTILIVIVMVVLGLLQVALSSGTGLPRKETSND